MPARWHALWWRIRGRLDKLIRPDWLIAVAFTVGMALLGAALGIIPEVAAEQWTAASGRRAWMLWLAGGAVLLLLAGVLLWRHRTRLLHRRGTAYIVEATSAGWQPEDKHAFLTAMGAQFASVLKVPGPGDLGADWTWPLDHRTGEWDSRVDELVQYFLATCFNDDHLTANTLYLWAPWSVAMAFGARITKASRSLNLHVRQRPSDGRTKMSRKFVDFTQAGHTFRTDGSPTPTPPGGATLTATVTTRAHPAILRSQPATDSARPPTDKHPTSEVMILLIRTTDQPFGPLPATHGKAPAEPVTFNVIDGAGLALPAADHVTVLEWRCLPTGSLHVWDEYPAIVEQAATWICRQHADHPGATLLLATAMPQEIGTGLGIHATTRPDWPDTLWPMIFIPHDTPFRVPLLNLGRATAH
jgi:hypothetical protein